MRTKALRRQAYRLEIVPGYNITYYGRGEPCKKGETKARTGCTPVDGDGEEQGEDPQIVDGI